VGNRGGKLDVRGKKKKQDIVKKKSNQTKRRAEELAEKLFKVRNLKTQKT